MKDLKRTAYLKLLIWKQRPDHKTLEVSGARQVGKTYLNSRIINIYKNRKGNYEKTSLK